MSNEKNSSMELKNYNVYFFFGILCLVSVATFYIFKPFLIALLLAAILAIFFYRMYTFFLSITGNRKSLSSLISSLIILLIIVIPFIILSVFVGREIMSLYHSIAVSGDFYKQKISPIIEQIQTSQFSMTLGLDQFLNKESFAQYFRQLGQLSLVIAQNAYLSITNVLFMIFVMFFALYYFFIDGKEMIQKIMYISPLRNLHENLLIEKFISMSRATIKGTFVICIVQGWIGGMVFFLAGVPSPIIWGVVMMICGLVPMFGAAIIWFPVAIILLMSGSLWQGILVMLVGVFLISTIDNILKPKLVGNGAQLHPLLVLIATLGGLALFGITGFIVGPIIVALFISLWDIYGIEFKGQLKKYNS
jgi:predicted PurR-regulated permease PerM